MPADGRWDLTRRGKVKEKAVILFSYVRCYAILHFSAHFT